MNHCIDVQPRRPTTGKLIPLELISFGLIHGRLASGVLVAMLLTGAAQAADEPAPFAWSSQTLAVIASGDAERGRAVAEDRRCSKCHGEAGIAEDDETPSIAGQRAAYNFKQMIDYRTEVRESRDMKKATRRLSVQDMADLAAYFETLPPEPAAVTDDPPLLVTRGDLDRLLLPCDVCHGKQGEGLGFEVPAISGQKVDHFVELMQAFKTGERQNDEYARMRFISSQLTDDEIIELAAWYAAPRSEEGE
ncbi:c-type cytochrome [Thiohalocapsa marina]|nr:c-type cytochrome [Thiohalocapsa marina]